MSKRCTLASLDARVVRLEDRMTAQDDKLDKLIRLVEEQGRTKRMQLTLRAKIITTAIGAAAGVLTAWLAGGCA